MDQDDSMLSTPSSHPEDDTYDEDNLFPEEAPANDHLNASAPGELSPPRSTTETQTQVNGSTNPTTASGKAVEVPEEEDDEAIDVKERAMKNNKDAPGYGWKNKKAQDEMSRAWEYVVDRDFDSRVFGDVLDPLGKGPAQ